jgi:hypothetical protein
MCNLVLSVLNHSKDKNELVLDILWELLVHSDGRVRRNVAKLFQLMVSTSFFIFLMTSKGSKSFVGVSIDSSYTRLTVGHSCDPSPRHIGHGFGLESPPKHRSRLWRLVDHSGRQVCLGEGYYCIWPTCRRPAQASSYR